MLSSSLNIGQILVSSRPNFDMFVESLSVSVSKNSADTLYTNADIFLCIQLINIVELD
jgi:hypothetical protein